MPPLDSSYLLIQFLDPVFVPVECLALRVGLLPSQIVATLLDLVQQERQQLRREHVLKDEDQSDHLVKQAFLDQAPVNATQAEKFQ